MYGRVLKAEVNGVVEKLRKRKVVVKILEAEEVVLSVTAFFKVKISATVKAADMLKKKDLDVEETPRLEFMGSRLAFIGLFVSPVMVVILAVLSLILIADVFIAAALIAVSLVSSFLLVVDPFSPDFMKRLMEKDQELREGVLTILKFVKEALGIKPSYELETVVTLLDKTYIAKIRQLKNGVTIILSPTSPW